MNYQFKDELKGSSYYCNSASHLVKTSSPRKGKLNASLGKAQEAQ
jgi:hypothetical protein